MVRLLIDIYVSQVHNAAKLPFPPTVAAASAEYFEENNPLAIWLLSHLITNGPNSAMMTPSDILSHYRATTHSSTNKDMTSQRIGTLLSSLGYSSKKSNGKVIYRGFLIKE
jgi:hypothetical protein